MSVELYKNGDDKTAALRQSVSVEDNADDGVTGKWTNPSISLPQLIVSLSLFYCVVEWSCKKYS